MSKIVKGIVAEDEGWYAGNEAKRRRALQAEIVRMNPGIKADRVLAGQRIRIPEAGARKEVYRAD